MKLWGTILLSAHSATRVSPNSASMRFEWRTPPRAGERVRATNVEISTDTAIVMVNWR